MKKKGPQNVQRTPWRQKLSACTDLNTFKNVKDRTTCIQYGCLYTADKNVSGYRAQTRTKANYKASLATFAPQRETQKVSD